LTKSIDLNLNIINNHLAIILIGIDQETKQLLGILNSWLQLSVAALVNPLFIPLGFV
jgi:hypothetical protein